MLEDGEEVRVGERVDGDAVPTEFDDRALEGRGREGGVDAAVDARLEQRHAAAVGDLFGQPAVEAELALVALDLLGQEFGLLDVAGIGFDRRHVGLGVHPCGPRKGSKVARRRLLGRIAGLLGDALDGRRRAFGDRLDGEGGGLGVGGDDGDRVGGPRADRLPKRVDLRVGHAVGRELVGVEDPAGAVALGVIREFGAEAAVGLDLSADEAVEAEQRDGRDGAARIERAADDARISVLENRRYLLRVADAGISVGQFVGDLDEFGLPLDLAFDDLVDPIERLDALDLDASAVGDRDVDVLPDGAESAFDRPGRSQEHPDPRGRLLGLLWAPDVRAGADFDQRDAESVEAVKHAVVTLFDPLGGLLFEQQIDDRDRALAGVDLAVLCEQHRPLEARGVRAVDDELPHDVKLINDVHIQQRGDLHGDRQRLVVDLGRRLVVLLDQTGGVVGEVLEGAVDPALLEGGVVEFAEFALGRMEKPRDRSLGGLGLPDRRRRATEQLRLGVELLVDFEPGDQAE